MVTTRTYLARQKAQASVERGGRSSPMLPVVDMMNPNQDQAGSRTVACSSVRLLEQEPGETAPAPRSYLE